MFFISVNTTHRLSETAPAFVGHIWSDRLVSLTDSNRVLHVQREYNIAVIAQLLWAWWAIRTDGCMVGLCRPD